MTTSQQSTQHGKSEVWVYVLDVTFFGEYGWTSVHATREGAEARLQAKVDEYGARDAFEAMEVASDAGCTAAGNEGDDVTYGISYLPLETP